MQPTSASSFIQISDPHWGEPSHPVMALSGQRLNGFLADADRLMPKPDLVLLTGDLCEWGDTRAEDLQQARGTLASLKAPVRLAPGNHDLRPVPPEGEALPPLTETNWYRAFGDEGLFWTAPCGPVELVGFALRNGDPDGQLDRLETYLKTPAERPRIVTSHYPVYSVRSGGILTRFGLDEAGSAAERVDWLLRRYSDSVVAYLFGHLHVLSAGVRNGVLHACGGAISAGAVGYRLWHATPEGLSCRFYALSDPTLVACNFWDVVDPHGAASPEHPTVDLYHMGLPTERDFYFDFRTRTMRPLDE